MERELASERIRRQREQLTKRSMQSALVLIDPQTHRPKEQQFRD